MNPTFSIFSFDISAMIACYLTGTLLAFVCWFVTRKKFKLSKSFTVIACSILVFTGILSMKFMGEIRAFALNQITGEKLFSGSIRIFGVILFQPLFIFLLSKIFRKDFRILSDFITLGTFICLIFGKLTCVFEGCCHGYPYENGIYSVIYEGNVFPIQIIETMLTLILTIVLLILAYKAPLCSGSLFPIGSIIYSGFRFICEYLRYYEYDFERNFLPGISFWQLCCIIAVILHSVWLILLFTNAKKRDYKKEKP